VTKSQVFLENAEHCAQLGEMATDGPTQRRFKRMEEAWRALAYEQDWLDGQVPPNCVTETMTAADMVQA
jgi:hypothetical protein